MFRNVFRWKIGRNVRIGFSTFICNYLEIGDDVKIGHFNVFNRVKRVVLKKGIVILNCNYFSGVEYEDWPSELIVGDGTIITSHHFFDCGGEVQIGKQCTIGGRDTHFWSHSRRKYGGQPKLEWCRIVVRDGCYIGARVTLVGAKLPRNAVVAAGAVVTKDFSEVKEEILLAGNPAVVKTQKSQS